VAVSRDESRSTLAVSLINRGESETLSVELELSSGEIAGAIRRFEITGDGVHASNDFDHPENVTATQTSERHTGSRLTVQLPAHSHTVLRMDTT